MSVELINFGCRLNLAEGEAMRTALDGTEYDLILVNSCAVTAEAERQARQAIRRVARARPDARILVAGCGAEIGAFDALPNVERFARPRLVRPAVSGADHARAFIEVQNGCDHDCTFCITTIARGPSRSVPAEAVAEAVRACVERGQHEVVLTGVDLTDTRPSLGALVARILKDVPELPRLRLSSLDSVEIDPLLEEIVTGEPRLMPHIHLSLQSGDDLILKRMKRRHSRSDAVALVERLKAKRPEIAIGADMIAGFPTEDEAMFANSLSLLDDCDIVFAHIFPYSPRPGTAAARMPQLGRAIAKERAARLRERAEARKATWLRNLVGAHQRVLIERDGETGHAENFAPVRLEAAPPGRDMRGAMIDMHITGSDGARLTGIPA